MTQTNSNIIKAQNWFDLGERIQLDLTNQQIPNKEENNNISNLFVFQRLIQSKSNANCITMLPGFPDGSYGWSKVESFLSKTNTSTRIYLDYIGQGDSDKPKIYKYGIKERADLVEALWKVHDITQTFIVTFDYSSLVAMELLRRQESKSVNKVKITKVLFINGGYFADAHSHPLMTTPILKTPFGKIGSWFIQRFPFLFNFLMKDLWSKKYKISKEELREYYNAITRRNGALFLHSGAGFVDEHKRNGIRLDLLNILKTTKKNIPFYIIGSEKDQFEPMQVVKAKERLKEYNVDIRMVPGGHMTTSEYPNLLANIINEIDQNK